MDMRSELEGRSLMSWQVARYAGVRVSTVENWARGRLVSGWAARRIMEVVYGRRGL